MFHGPEQTDSEDNVRNRYYRSHLASQEAHTKVAILLC